jgi:nicotinate-nucleotide--dimethylbenzimidazole phosphoribosyltransferase
MKNLLPPIPAACDDCRTAAVARQARLTKPPGSLGRLEQIAIDIAAWQATHRPAVRPGRALIFAADHPVASAGVSPYPQAVTRAMVRNFVSGGAAATVMAHRVGVPLDVIDVGVHGGPVEPPQPHDADRGPATYTRAPVADAEEADVRCRDAMTADVFTAALAAGSLAVRVLPADTRCVILGEMGIGNSLLAAAVTSALCGAAPEQTTGPGTGASGPCFERKLAAVRLVSERVTASPPLEILRRAGGRELAAIAGAAAEALARRIVVVADGFIACAALAPLVAVEPAARAGIVFAHVSREPGHRLLLDWLGASPLVNLGMALGEGTGGLAVLPLLDLACAAHNSMATFAEAGVPGPTAAADRRNQETAGPDRLPCTTSARPPGA